MLDLLKGKYDQVAPQEIERAVEQFSDWKTRAILLYRQVGANIFGKQPRFENAWWLSLILATNITPI